MKILISGGHLTPALALIDFAKSQTPAPEIVFVGRTFAQMESGQISREKQELESRGIPFITLNSGKLAQGSVGYRLTQLWLLMGGFVHSLGIMLQQRPDVFLSFGGYLALPLAITAWIFRIPIVTHEQTRTAGLANQFIAKFARSVAISFPSSQQFFDPNKTVLTGNPIRHSLKATSTKAPEWFKPTSCLPVLYVTGGSQGSEVINATVSSSLSLLLKSWVVIHQCGASTKKRNYLAELTQKKNQLPRTKQNQYFVREWVSDQELAWIYKHATAAVSRSGANSVLELSSLAIPTVFIPLAFSHQNEQWENAQALARQKAAIVLAQKQLSPNTLNKALSYVGDHHKLLVKRLKSLTFIADADQKLYQLVVATARE